MEFFEELEDEQLKTLVEKFDGMIQSGDRLFFDVEEFEMIIDHYLILNQLDKTNIAIKYAMEQYPHIASFMLKKAQMLVSSNNINKALELLMEVENIEPENPEIFLTKAGIYSQLKR
jgi:predicted Zn-dependent protease